MDSSSLQPKTGYWLWAKESGTLNLPAVGGTLAGETYAWNKLRLHNGTDELNITDASSAGWVLPQTIPMTDRGYINYEDGGFKFVCEGTGWGYPFNCKSTTLNSWVGYFIWSEYDNITLVRQN